MIILTIAAAAILLSDIFKDLEFTVKPFICPRCMAFWLSVIAFIILHIQGNTIEYKLAVLFLPYILTKIVNKYLWS